MHQENLKCTIYVLFLMNIKQKKGYMLETVSQTFPLNACLKLEFESLRRLRRLDFSMAKKYSFLLKLLLKLLR